MLLMRVFASIVGARINAGSSRTRSAMLWRGASLRHLVLRCSPSWQGSNACTLGHVFLRIFGAGAGSRHAMLRCSSHTKCFCFCLHRKKRRDFDGHQWSTSMAVAWLKKVSFSMAVRLQSSMSWDFGISAAWVQLSSCLCAILNTLLWEVNLT